jgi:hypothetical protein
VIVLDGPGEVGGVLDGFVVCGRIAQFRDYWPTLSARRSGTSGRRDHSGSALMSGEAEAEVMSSEAEEEVMSGKWCDAARG